MNLKDSVSRIKNQMTPAKKRQYILASALFFGVLGLSWAASYAIKKSDDSKPTSVATPSTVDKTDLSKPDEVLNNEGIWKANAGTKLDVMQKDMEEFKRWREQQDTKANSSQGANAPALPNFDGTANNLPPVPPANGIKAGQGIPVEQTTTMQTSMIRSLDLSKGLAPNKQSPSVEGGVNTVYTTGIRPNIVVTEDGGNVAYNGDQGTLNSTGKFRAQKSYIPSGTFFRAILLGGMDAPTGGESATASPYPVLMRVADLAQLPNRFRLNFKECFITGTGYGDLSSERAIIRTEQLSCVGFDGKAIDIAIKGYVAGEDGKAGIRGRLVTKQGAVLKNALITGLLSGIGQGFSTAASTVNQTALGSVTSVSKSEQMQAALGSGVGGAFDKLAQYYIKLADKMFPVIEIDAGRKVDVVLLKGFQIEGEK